MKKRILFVEDEADLLELLKLAFEEAGWSVHTAQNGVEALAKLKTEEVDVIFSDIQMPEMNGLELLKEIARQELSIPFVFISSFRDIEKMKLAWGLGAFDFIDKPFDMQSLLRLADNAYEYGDDYTVSARNRYKNLKSA